MSRIIFAGSSQPITIPFSNSEEITFVVNSATAIGIINGGGTDRFTGVTAWQDYKCRINIQEFTVIVPPGTTTDGFTRQVQVIFPNFRLLGTCGPCNSEIVPTPKPVSAIATNVGIVGATTIRVGILYGQEELTAPLKNGATAAPGITQKSAFTQNNKIIIKNNAVAIGLAGSTACCCDDDGGNASISFEAAGGGPYTITIDAP